MIINYMTLHNGHMLTKDKREVKEAGGRFWRKDKDKDKECFISIRDIPEFR